MGVLDSQKSKNKKLTQKHQALFEKKEKEMNHNHTPHPMALQRSKYICVDVSIEKKHVLGMNEKLVKKQDKNSFLGVATHSGCVIITSASKQVSDLFARS